MSKNQGYPRLLHYGVPALFFLSGGTGLAYEVIGFKRFAHVWGSSTLAMAAVVASFLFGLGLGAPVLGRVADRLRTPLKWYGVCELGIGVLALVIPVAIQWLLGITGALFQHLREVPVLYFLARFGLTFLVIGPPSFFRGGTLPLLVRQYFLGDRDRGETTAWLYGINTFGAAVGCYLTGFHLLPSLGLEWTNNLAVLLNLAIGIFAIGIVHFLSNDERLAVALPPVSPSQVQPPNDAVLSPAAIYLALALTGCGSLLFQMIWARQLALVLGGSTYAFTATLVVILAGIGLGSLGSV